MAAADRSRAGSRRARGAARGGHRDGRGDTGGASEERRGYAARFVSPQRDRKARRATRQAAPSRDRTAARRRFGMLVFAILFVGLFAGFAVAQGLGKPDVPSDAVVIVEDAPSDDSTVTDCHGKQVQVDPGTITREELDCAMKQVAAQGGVKKFPKPGTIQYKSLVDTAISDLLDSVWIQGE